MGAETVDLKIPEMTALLRTSGAINAEFKFDLEDYLARSPAPPVRSLGEILERGLYHASLEGSYRRRNAVTSRVSEEYRKVLEGRAALRRTVTTAVDDNHLTAIVYPTVRRKAAPIGDAQGGVNCSLSAQSGLPAISAPAGFTDDGMPIGLELLGPAFSEASLLSLAYSFEQAAHVRAPPTFTPALQHGRAPTVATFIADATSIRVKFSYDPVEGRLRYEVPAGGGQAAEIVYATIHRGAVGETGPALFTLRGSRALPLALRDRSDLMQGRLYLMIATRANPEGSRTQLKLP